MACVYVCRSEQSCDFEAALGPSFVSSAIITREMEPNGLFAYYNVLKGPCIFVVKDDGSLITILRPYTIMSAAKKNMFVGTLIREL